MCVCVDRIELGEVEMAVSGHSSVAQAVVIVKDNTLVCYIQLKIEAKKTVKDAHAWAESVKTFAGKSVPHYMIPKHVLMIDEFPTTANGKLDKLTLTNRPLPMLADIGEMTRDAGPTQESESLGVSGERSMLSYILELTFKISGRKPNPESSFATVGIDSLAAILFKNFLSKSLGDLPIDQNELYDADATISSFSQCLYERMQREKPQVLSDLKITCGLSVSEEKKQSGQQMMMMGEGEKQGKQDSLNKVLLSSRRLLDGFRGFLTILVLVDHFFYDDKTKGSRLHADTLLFVIMTGYTTTLQVIASKAELAEGETERWDWRSFLFTRAFGLFPIYWLAMVFDTPRVIIKYDRFDLTPGSFAGWVVLSFFGLQAFAPTYNSPPLCCPNPFVDLYYVDLIWSVLIVYAVIKAAYHARSWPTWLRYSIMGAAVISMVIFYILVQKGTTTPVGSMFMLVGFITAHVLEYCRVRLGSALTDSLDDACMTSSSHGMTDIEAASSIPTSCQSDKPESHAESHMFLHKDGEEHKRSGMGGDDNDINAYVVRASDASAGMRDTYIGLGKLRKYYGVLWALLIDGLAFALLFLTFYNDYPGMPVQATVRSAYGTFDTVMKLAGLPLLFCALLVTTMLRPNTRSVFVLLLSETYVIPLMGEASLAIYLYQNVLVTFWFNFGLAGILSGQFPYTKAFVYGGNSYLLKYDSFRVVAVLLAIAVCILIQKVYQDRIVTGWYLRWLKLRNK